MIQGKAVQKWARETKLETMYALNNVPLRMIKKPKCEFNPVRHIKPTRSKELAAPTSVQKEFLFK